MNLSTTFLRILPFLSFILLIVAWNIPALSLFVLLGFTPLMIWLNACIAEKRSTKLVSILLFVFLFCVSGINLAWMFTGETLLRPFLAITAYSLIATLCWVAIYRLMSHKNNFFALACIVALLVVHDYLHLFAEFGFPVLSLGNYFRHNPSLIQWYSMTGVLGGSLWVAITNVLMYALVINDTKKIKAWGAVIALSASPFIISLISFNTYEEKGEQAEVVSLHPDSIAKVQLALLEQAELSETDLIVLPESALNEGEWLENVDYWEVSNYIKGWLGQKETKAVMLVGGIFHEQYSSNTRTADLPVGVDASSMAGGSYYNFNTALSYVSEQPTTYRVKERLVPFEESFPYADQLNLRAIPLLDLSSLIHRGPGRTKVFNLMNSRTKVGALICYEAAFGAEAAKMSNKNAGVLAVMTNEGWFSGLMTSREFAALTSLRAIETRRPIVRSSNRGISSVYDQRGVTLKSMEGNKEGFIKAKVNLNRQKTFYTQYGDFLGILAIGSLPFLLFLTTYNRKSHALSAA